MPRSFAILGSLLALALVIFLLMLAVQEYSPVTQYQRLEAARHEAAMNRIAEAEAFERGQLLTPLLALAAGILALGGSVAAVTLLGIYALHRLQFVDVTGVSVSRQLALDGATVPAMMVTVSAAGQASIEAARNPAPILPANLRSYSPRYSSRGEGAGARSQGRAEIPALAPSPPALGPVAVPTLAQVLAARPPREVVVGYERSGDPLTLGLDAIGATLVVGQRRMGKSTTVAVLATQLAVMRAQFFGVDPHGARDDSLARRLAPLGNRVALWATTPAEAEGVLRAVESELARRIAGEEGDPCVLLVDELHSLTLGPWADVGAEIARLAQRLAEEGGKLGMGVIAAAHLANVDSLGGHLAYTASTVITHQAVPDTVRRFVGPDLARQTRHLARGEVLVKHPAGWGLLRVPRAEPSDIMQAVATLPRLEPGTVREPGTAEPPVPALAAENRSQEPRFPIELRPLTEGETEAVRRMRAGGMSLTAINYAVFGNYKNDRTWKIIETALQEA